MKFHAGIASIVLSLIMTISGCVFLNSDMSATEARFKDYYTKYSQAPSDAISAEHYLSAYDEHQYNISHMTQHIHFVLDSELDDEWDDRVLAAFSTLRDEVHQFRGLQPSTAHTHVHDLVIEAAWHYDRAIDIVENHLKYEAEMNNAALIKLFTEAEVLLTRSLDVQLNIVTPEHGGLTVEQLEELDALAGIDRKSVVNNISASGKELVGHWGRMDENDNVIVEMSLFEDGTHIGYPRGEYPSLDNSFNGRWHYDSTWRYLTFYVDQNFKDGQETEAGLDSFVMEVQAFNNNAIQMTNVKTWSTFNFYKAE